MSRRLIHCISAAAFVSLGALPCDISSADSTHVLATAPVGKQVACSTQVASAANLDGIATHFSRPYGQPFGVAFEPNGSAAFVTDATGALYEFSSSSTTGPIVLRQGTTFQGYGLRGIAVTPNGRYVVAASQTGALVFSVKSIRTKPASDWIVGRFSSRGSEAIETAVSPDGRYVFVSLEDSDQLAVFNLGKALREGFKASDLVGYVNLGVAPVGIAIGPSGHYLYVTSEETKQSTQGTLTTLNLKELVLHPARSIVSTVWAGCSPVRVVATKSSVYATARESDAVVAFSASDLSENPGHALKDELEVGQAPVGITSVESNTLVIADSDRFLAPGAVSNLAVVSIGTNGVLQLTGYVAAGQFPRDIAADPGGRLVVVCNWASGQVETLFVPSDHP
jgi:DNA-binding beta-propeller fold protein YncE